MIVKIKHLPHKLGSLDFWTSDKSNVMQISVTRQGAQLASR